MKELNLRRIVTGYMLSEPAEVESCTVSGIMRDMIYILDMSMSTAELELMRVFECDGYDIAQYLQLGSRYVS